MPFWVRASKYPLRTSAPNAGPARAAAAALLPEGRMRPAVGYVGLAVVAAGLVLANPYIVGSGLSFLLGWQAIHLRRRQ